MPAPSSPSFGALALACLAAGVVAVVALTRMRLRVRAVSQRWLGVHICDIGADLDLAPRLRSRGYRIAFYVTMKSLPRETQESKPVVRRVTSNVA